jgi:predicted naringenin-chalcone synthase
MTGCAIAGLGTTVPPHAIEQAEAAEVARVLCHEDGAADLLPQLYRQTGIRKRHLVFHPNVVADVLQGTQESGSVFLPSGRADDAGPSTRQRMQLYVEEAGPLALRAARQALADSGLSPDRFTHLITVSCTGFHAPGVDARLIGELRLDPSVERTHVGFMGCHGALNGLRVARAFTGTDAGARVLLCAVELCSLHYHYRWDPKRMVANALFADGAAALVCVPPGAAPGGAWQVAATGSCLFPDCAYAMTWDVGDHGFEMTLSTRVPRLLADHLRPWLERWLRQHGLTVEGVASWAIHPGGPRILSAVAEGLGLGPGALETSRDVLAEYGNMSLPTVVFILERLRRRQAPRPCVALGFGPGLTAEAALFV